VGYTLGTIVNSAVISNGEEIITRTAAVHVVSPVKDAVISGPTKGYSGTAYLFSAIVSPVTATLPITYIWQTAEQWPMTYTSDSLTGEVAFTWNTTGTKSITVTAMNVAGTVTGTYAITIETVPKVFLPLVLRQIVCTPLYSDDFGNPASGWPSGEDANAAYGYVNGEYRILLKSAPYAWAGKRPGFKASDYSVVVDARNASGSGVTSYYGILFGISDDWSQAYFFWISSFGYTGISRYNSSSGWLNLSNSPSSYINPGAATNQLKVERNGSQIKGYVNGHLVTSISDSTYTGLRHVGLGVMSSSQPNVDARFDNFVVYPLGCSAATATLRAASASPAGEVMEAGLLSTWEGGYNRRTK
jgi:hypothetical protein